MDAKLSSETVVTTYRIQDITARKTTADRRSVSTVEWIQLLPYGPTASSRGHGNGPLVSQNTGDLWLAERPPASRTLSNPGSQLLRRFIL